jgi:hypothetical protein
MPALIARDKTWQLLLPYFFKKVIIEPVISQANQ